MKSQLAVLLVLSRVYLVVAVEFTLDTVSYAYEWDNYSRVRIGTFGFQ
jgi:hypothetical protein